MAQPETEMSREEVITARWVALWLLALALTVVILLTTGCASKPVETVTKSVCMFQTLGVAESNGLPVARMWCQKEE